MALISRSRGVFSTCVSSFVMLKHTAGRRRDEREPVKVGVDSLSRCACARVIFSTSLCALPRDRGRVISPRVIRVVTVIVCALRRHGAVVIRAADIVRSGTAVWEDRGRECHVSQPPPRLIEPIKPPLLEKQRRRGQETQLGHTRPPPPLSRRSACPSVFLPAQVSGSWKTLLASLVWGLGKRLCLWDLIWPAGPLLPFSAASFFLSGSITDAYLFFWFFLVLMGPLKGLRGIM